MSGADTPAKAVLAEIDTLSINTIRTLAIDAVQKANSGHAGAPMGLAPVAYTLWNRYLRYDPAHPHWPNRDRFVLSCGHASMLLYALLHLAGVAESDGGNAPAVTLEDIKKFRQLDSRTPGHPEYHFTTGVETTTGPLGQGVANSVGMAMGSRYLGQHLNRPGLPLFDYNVYAICSDGDLMEGVASEAASLAGHLRLGNLCWIYDDNTITIEGAHRTRLRRGGRDPVPGLWLAGAARRRRQRRAVARRLDRDVPGHQRPADADHRQVGDRLRRAEQAGHPEGPF